MLTGISTFHLNHQRLMPVADKLAFAPNLLPPRIMAVTGQFAHGQIFIKPFLVAKAQAKPRAANHLLTVMRQRVIELALIGEDSKLQTAIG